METETEIPLDERMALIQTWVRHHVANSQEWHLPFLHLHLPSWLSLHAVMLIIAALILIGLFCVLYRKDQRVPTGLTNLLESFVVFVRDEIAIAYLGEEDGRRFAPYFCTLFMFILTLNLMGLVPLFSTATANYNVTGGLAAITLSMIFIGGIVKHGPIGFLKALVPHGLPGPMAIVIVPLEIVSNVIKCLALTIRLFANLTAGHIVVLSLVGLSVAFGLLGSPAILMALGITLIEVLVAFIQAYIFTLLSALFIGHIYHPAH